ncbi:hypothetical protein HKCCSP123_08315 [Rhodobacterales bacterium HKCCSP123]|nr:hypothetical protein [Rhodobacterales bacterium HKCCSP123]
MADQRTSCRQASFPDDWVSVGWLSARRLNKALARELRANALPAGMSFSAILRSLASDDVLFALSDGQFALAHLSYSSDPNWKTGLSLFASCTDVAAYLRSNETWELAWQRSEDFGAAIRDQGQTAICGHCGADWSLSETGSECEICDGWALARPCPVCDGACGAIWRRATSDSNDEQAPVFFGRCAATP